MMMATATKKVDSVRARRADSRDREVGLRVRTRRIERRLSQTDLAGKIGVTFQQVQKYEKGVNRIGASRIEQIAEALGTPISFFFGAGATTGALKQFADTDAGKGGDSLFTMLQTPQSVRVVKAFHKIKSRSARAIALAVVEEFAGISGSIIY